VRPGSDSSRPQAVRLLIGAGIALLAMTGSACAEVEAKKIDEYQPGSVSTANPAEGPWVTLTKDSAQRIDLATSKVSGAEPKLVVEYAALIYDKQGKTWVYRVVRPLTYQRAKVVVARIDGNRVTLSEGPPPGTEVVTRGVTQVYGTELGMAGKH
jgi:hypothetical protein